MTPFYDKVKFIKKNLFNKKSKFNLTTFTLHSTGIVPICLPINSAMRGPFKHKYIVTGFGLTEHGRESDVMLKIFVPLVEKETCQSFHRSLITLSEGHECYGGEGVTDSCKGLTN
jgi:hypothetical protein